MAKPPRRAAKAFEDFSGHRATKIKTSRLDDRDVTGWRMGPVVGIAYEATRDGERQRYFHEFKKSARPDLVAKDDGSQLYIDGGKYKVTERGIEDMPQLFVVNPSPRKGKTRGKTMVRRRTATRRRATRQVAVFRANPAPAPRRRRRKTAVRRSTFRANPAPRRSRRPARKSVVRRYRRNPSARGLAGGAVNFGKMLLPAAGIGLGAIGAEIFMGYLPIPAGLKVGVMRHVTKGVVGVGAGLVIGKVLRQKKLGNYIALGAVVIAVHDAAKEFIASKMPDVRMGQYRGAIPSSLGGYGMGYVNPAQLTTMGEYVDVPNSSFAGVASQHGVGGETDYWA